MVKLSKIIYPILDDTDQPGFRFAIDPPLKETGADGRVYLPSLASRQLLRKRHHHLQFVWYPIPSRSFLDHKSGYGKDGVERSYQ